MARFLLVLVLLIAFALLARQAVRRLLATPLGRQLTALWRALEAIPSGSSRPPASRDERGPVTDQELVQCPGCGVYVPSKSLRGSGSDARCHRCLDGESG